MKIAIVGCAKTKLTKSAPARALYTSALFTKALAWAEAPERAFDRVFVLSALHGLVKLDQVVRPYDQTMAHVQNPRAWGRRVVEQLVAELGTDPEILVGVELIILAGAAYTDPIRPAARTAGWFVTEPLAGMQVGERLRFLTRDAP